MQAYNLRESFIEENDKYSRYQNSGSICHFLQVFVLARLLSNVKYVNPLYSERLMDWTSAAVFPATNSGNIRLRQRLIC